jgi:hypothetical protein
VSLVENVLVHVGTAISRLYLVMNNLVTACHSFITVTVAL